MRRELKILFIGIISLSVIITTYSVILLQKEESVNSNNDDNDPTYVRELTSSPKGIRLTYVHNFSDSIVISWFTEKNASEPQLLYSNKSNLSDFIGISPNMTKFSNSAYFYTAELIDLQPNKTYFYRVSSDNNNVREIMNFTTLANETGHVRFLVYGDSRTQRNVRSILASKIMENFNDSFDFSLLLGDIVEFGSLQDQWNEYFSDTEVINAYKQGIYVEGNHEQGDLTKMYDNLPMQNTATNRYYSFSYGGIGFIILNSNNEAIDDDVQTNWLNQTLIQFSQKNTFNFAFMHHPLVNELRTDLYFTENWRPLFEKYNVSIIFAGHDHLYERSYPILNSSTLKYDNSELYNYININDSIYITTGGAGAPLKIVHSNGFIAKTISGYHFLLVDIEKNIITSTLSLETWVMPGDFSNLYLYDNITITNFN